MPESQSGGDDDRVLKLESGDLLAFDHFRNEVRVFKSEQMVTLAAMTLPHAQKAARDFNLWAQELQAALCELWRAITEDDGTDCDEARLQDALANAKRLAPYEPEEPDENGF